MATAEAVKTLTLNIDGQDVTVPEGTTIYDAARSGDGGGGGREREIPTLCHQSDLSPVGVCRVCAVEVEGARVLAASCCREAEAGMTVRTNSDRVKNARRMLVELLMADHPAPCERHRKTRDCELEVLAERLGVTESRLAPRARANGRDVSSKVIDFDHSACILCDRCIRACADLQSNDVIGRSGKGFLAKIGFDFDLPMGESTCVACGECVAACPTGALTEKPLVAERTETALAVDSLCPYCGVGCSITYHVEDNRIVGVTGRESPVNHGRLCVKGRYGYDYAHHKDRLTVPLIRKEGVPKDPGALDDPMDAFREASWDEAMEKAAGALAAIRDAHGPSALAGFGSAKCSNEDNYLFQKLVRAVFGTNNVDHCTRLCHASSVAALMEQIGSGAVSNVFADVALADVALVAGSNTEVNHPVAATFMKEAHEAGTKLIVTDPRKVSLARCADLYVGFKPGTDVAFFNGMLHVIFRDGLEDEAFIARRTEGVEALRRTVAAYPPERVEKITGVKAGLIEEVARVYGSAVRAITFWGMGISQHTTGTDNARCLVNLALVTGNIGRPGTGLHPLRGQNNVQGASDVGLIPIVYTDYQSVKSPEVKAKFEKAWGVPLSDQPGLTVVEIMHGALEGQIKGMYIMGENPFLSDPNTNKVRKALAAMEFLVVQDIFLTQTARYADIVLPATAFPEKTGTYTNTDRRVQLGRKALEPPGEARTDWEVVAEMGTRMGYPMKYGTVEDIFKEIRTVTPTVAGITYDRLEREGGINWPCPDENHPGTSILFEDTFPSGRGKLVACEWKPAFEVEDEEYPFVLNTGRMLEHWHTGVMTRRSKALDGIQPEALVEMHPDDLEAVWGGGRGAKDGGFVRVSSRRGEIRLKAVGTDHTPRGSVFIPFHFEEAAANLLTIDALDPYGKIPEFKYCAVRVVAD